MDCEPVKLCIVVLPVLAYTKLNCSTSSIHLQLLKRDEIDKVK